MVRTTRGYPALALSSVLCFPHWTWALPYEEMASDTGDHKVMVLVYNYASVSHETKAKAQDCAAMIFRQAGVRVMWVDAAEFKKEFQSLPDRQQKLDSIDVILRIVAHSRTALKDTAVGEALPCRLGQDACIANIFMSRVEERTAADQISSAELLGHAIAHEMGHILLGSNSHDSNGVMQSKWGQLALKRAAKGRLLFTSDQSRAIRSNLLGRTRK
jgi:hypothetical protein